MHRVLFAIAILSTSADIVKEDVKIRVSPLVISCAISDPRIWITSTIKDHPDNRLLTVSWESKVGESGSTSYQLEGKASPKVFTIERRVDCMDYRVWSCIRRDGVRDEICASIVLLGGK